MLVRASPRGPRARCPSVRVPHRRVGEGSQSRSTQRGVHREPAVGEARPPVHTRAVVLEERRGVRTGTMSSSSSSSPPWLLSIDASSLERAVARTASHLRLDEWATANRRMPASTELDSNAVVALLCGAQACADVFTSQHDVVPRCPGTVALIVAHISVFCIPGGVAFNDVCLRPLVVVDRHQWSRLVTSAFVHRDVAHIVSNMSHLLYDGTRLERILGTPQFLLAVAASLVMSQSALVAVSMGDKRCNKRVGAAAVVR